jgi:hypothetical protein
MGPQVRMAASLSINKRKTYAADTRDEVARRGKVRATPRAAMALPERICGRDFHGFAR